MCVCVCFLSLLLLRSTISLVFLPLFTFQGKKVTIWVFFARLIPRITKSYLGTHVHMYDSMPSSSTHTISVRVFNLKPPQEEEEEVAISDAF